MKQRIEEHILLLLGNKPPQEIVSEQRLYMIMFLNDGADQYGKYRTSLFDFKRGKELPYSDRLFRAFRNPRFHRLCWVLDEHRGCRLTETGRKRFSEIIVKGRASRFKKISSQYAEIFLSIENTTDYELEKVIQLKYYKWVEVGGVDPMQEAPPKEGLLGEELTHNQMQNILQSGNKELIEKIANSYDHTTQQLRKATFLSMSQSRIKTLHNAMKGYSSDDRET